MMPCLNKQLFGVECPGCGIQRSVHLLFQGEFVLAFKMYPAIYPLVLLLLFLVTNLFIKFRYAHQIKLSLMLLTAGFILINYILKLSTILN